RQDHAYRGGAGGDCGRRGASSDRRAGRGLDPDLRPPGGTSGAELRRRHAVVGRQSELTSTADREIVVTRLFDAPRELVVRAWTEHERLVQWWGPDGFTTTIHEIDVRPGGVWRFIMHGPDGVDYGNKIVYLEVSAPERLVYLHGEDTENDAEQFHVTVTFAD